MHSIVCVLACLAIAGHALGDWAGVRASKSEKIVRSLKGEINDAELGMRNLMNAMQDLSTLKVMAEVLRQPASRPSRRFQEQSNRISNAFKPESKQDSMEALETLLLALNPSIASTRGRAARIVNPQMSESDDLIDKIVREEIEAAFAGLEAKFAAGEAEEALSIIETKGKDILANVFKKLEDDGNLLSSSLSSQVEALAADRTTELLKRYEDDITTVSSSITAERASIRSEMQQLESLNRELEELQAGRGGLSRDTIIGVLAVLIGLSGIGASISELGN